VRRFRPPTGRHPASASVWASACAWAGDEEESIRSKDITRPVPGNHEYHSVGAGGYFEYFADQMRRRAYYAWNAGAWRMYALNCEIDCGASRGSPAPGTRRNVTWPPCGPCCDAVAAASCSAGTTMRTGASPRWTRAAGGIRRAAPVRRRYGRCRSLPARGVVPLPARRSGRHDRRARPSLGAPAVRLAVRVGHRSDARPGHGRRLITAARRESRGPRWPAREARGPPRRPASARRAGRSRTCCRPRPPPRPTVARRARGRRRG